MGYITQLLMNGFSVETQLLIIFKIVLASILGFSIGWNRKSKNSGLRTFILITLGATIFTVISMYGFPNNSSVADQARVVAQIVSGVGFIGVGVIWKNKETITGLTTASAIWVSASIGIAVGVGMYILAIFGTGLTLIVLNLRKYLMRYESQDKDQVNDPK